MNAETALTDASTGNINVIFMGLKDFYNDNFAKNDVVNSEIKPNPHFFVNSNLLCTEGCCDFEACW